MRRIPISSFSSRPHVPLLEYAWRGPTDGALVIRSATAARSLLPAAGIDQTATGGGRKARGSACPEGPREGGRRADQQEANKGGGGGGAQHGRQDLHMAFRDASHCVCRQKHLGAACWDGWLLSEPARRNHGMATAWQRHGETCRRRLITRVPSTGGDMIGRQAAFFIFLFFFMQTRGTCCIACACTDTQMCQRIGEKPRAALWLAMMMGSDLPCINNHHHISCQSSSHRSSSPPTISALWPFTSSSSCMSHSAGRFLIFDFFFVHRPLSPVHTA